MAEGGIPVDSVLGQHEEFFEHICTRCEKREKNVEASCYCRSCDKYLCTLCRNVHEEFASDHAVLDESKSELWGVPNARNLDNDECSLHEGQHITIFCEQHEALGCIVCATSTHSSCDGKHFVPDLAKDISNNEEMTCVRSSISPLQTRLRKVRTAKQQMITSLKDSRTNYKETIAEFRTKVYALLSNLEKATSEKMEQLYQNRFSELQDQLEICDTLIQEFSDLDTELADENIVETKRFVIMQKGKEKILDCNDVLNNLSQPMHYDIVFSLDKTVLERLEETEHLGQFNPTPELGKSSEITGVKNFGQYKVRATEDKKKCDIQGICMLGNGTVLLSDHNNRNIKRLDGNYVTREVCPMPGNPNGICCTGNRSVAVALGSTKKIQMVAVTDKMRTTEELVFKHKCNRIAYYKDTLYITSGGLGQTVYHYKLEKNSGKTTYNLIRTFYETSPLSVAVSGDGNFVYIVGFDDKLTIQTKNGTIVQRTEHPNLKKYENPNVCVDMKGNVIVSGTTVGIIQFKDSGTQPNGKLIDSTSREVVAVDHIRSKLIVQRNDIFGGSDTVEVWDLVY